MHQRQLPYERSRNRHTPYGARAQHKRRPANLNRLHASAPPSSDANLASFQSISRSPRPRHRQFAPSAKKNQTNSPYSPDCAQNHGFALRFRQRFSDKKDAHFTHLPWRYRFVSFRNSVTFGFSTLRTFLRHWLGERPYRRANWRSSEDTVANPFISLICMTE